MILSNILRIIAAAISLYTLMCFVRIILTWIPSLSYSGFARFLSSVCDPYLNLFHGIRWLVMGSFDFSPALALCLLGAASSILNGLANGGTFSVGILLALFINMVWSIASSLVTFLIILLAIRLIILLVNKNSYGGNPIIDMVDRSVSSLVYNSTQLFTKGKNISYTAALVTTIILLIVINFIGSIVFGKIALLLASIPF